MWKKFKSFLIGIAAGLGAALLAIIFRSRTDRSGVPGADDLDRRIDEGAGRIKNRSEDIDAGIERSEGRQQSATRRSLRTTDKLSAARRILEGARKRNTDRKD